jgi:hypothetical protein
VEANITSPDGVQGVVEQVENGELPNFEHVHACGKYEISQVRAMKADGVMS